MNCDVIVPTFLRQAELARCIAALLQQSRAASCLWVAIRDTDKESLDVLPTSASVELVHVASPGVIAAMNAGLAVATGDIIAFTDDDAAPWPDWIERIVAHFEADPKLGVLGGKDWQYKPQRPGGPVVLDDGHETRAGHMPVVGAGDRAASLGRAGAGAGGGCGEGVQHRLPGRGVAGRGRVRHAAGGDGGAGSLGIGRLPGDQAGGVESGVRPVAGGRSFPGPAVRRRPARHVQQPGTSQYGL